MRTCEVRSEQHDNQGHRQPADQGGREVDLAKSEEQVQRLGHVIGECALVSGKCAQLTEDDEHGDTIQETGHDGIGDEAQDKA